MKFDFLNSDVYLNAYGPGINLVESMVKFSMQKPFFEGAASEIVVSMTSLMNNDCKFLRVQFEAGDDAARDWQKKMIGHLDKARNVPAGGFDEAKSAMSKYLQSFSKGMDTVVAGATDDGESNWAGSSHEQS